jgi:hypothetical protein
LEIWEGKEEWSPAFGERKWKLEIWAWRKEKRNGVQNLEEGKENWICGLGGMKRGVELRICRKEKRKRDLSGRKRGVELKMERKEERKWDLSLLKGKMNGNIILKERMESWVWKKEKSNGVLSLEFKSHSVTALKTHK